MNGFSQKCDRGTEPALSLYPHWAFWLRQRLPKMRKCVLFQSGITRTEQKKGHQQLSWRKKKRRKRRPDRPQASCSWLAPFFGHLICRLPFSFNTYERRESVRRRTDVKICVVGSKQAIFGPTQNKFKRLGFPLRPIRLAAPIRPALASSCWKK